MINNAKELTDQLHPKKRKMHLLRNHSFDAGFNSRVAPGAVKGAQGVGDGILLSAQKKWRKCNGQNRLAEILQRVAFRGGIKRDSQAPLAAA